MNGLRLHIVSPEREIFSGEVTSVTLPGVMGEFVILYGHAPIVSVLAAGNVSYEPTAGDGAQTLAIDGGFVEQNNNEATVCVELSVQHKNVQNEKNQ
ncbi:MAG: ATP synthase F1 subunit epsilon [Prevotellaceae bacterium]|jgi:F-type H+-transporting ATPase subunit epsilon|nr:ATP synthase F1 subunit epsilon [Prevotellaceae bacterium]